jgi:hypothetical protein
VRVCMRVDAGVRVCTDIRMCEHVCEHACTGMHVRVSMRVCACVRLLGLCVWVCDDRELEWRDAYVHVRVGT